MTKQDLLRPPHLSAEELQVIHQLISVVAPVGKGVFRYVGTEYGNRPEFTAMVKAFLGISEEEMPQAKYVIPLPSGDRTEVYPTAVPGTYYSHIVITPPAWSSDTTEKIGSEVVFVVSDQVDLERSMIDLGYARSVFIPFSEYIKGGN